METLYDRPDDQRARHQAAGGLLPIERAEDAVLEKASLVQAKRGQILFKEGARKTHDLCAARDRGTQKRR